MHLILIMMIQDYVKYCHVLDKIMTYFRLIVLLESR